MDKLETLQNRFDDWKQRYSAYKIRWSEWYAEGNALRTSGNTPSLALLTHRTVRYFELMRELDQLEAEFKRLGTELDRAGKPIVDKFMTGLSKN